MANFATMETAIAHAETSWVPRGDYLHVFRRIDGWFPADPYSVEGSNRPTSPGTEDFEEIVWSYRRPEND